MRVCIVIPALNAAPTIADVVRRTLAVSPTLLVVDDGSSDGTGDRAREAGAEVLRVEPNGGKGGAIVCGLYEAARRGFEAVVVLDADGQHDPAEIQRLLEASADPRALVLGVRDLRALGAPWLNRFANAAAAWPVSFLVGRWLRDALCGFRRYPLPATLRLAPSSGRYEWETAVILALGRTGTPIVETTVSARYGAERFSFFRPWVDTLRTIGDVLGRGFFGRGASRVWGRLARFVAAVVLVAVVGLAAAVRLVTPREPADRTAPPAVDATSRSQRGSIAFTRLRGGPYALGYRHMSLLSDLQEIGDREMIAGLRAHVRNPIVRRALLGAARLKFRHLTDDIPAARLREILGEARAYPDRFTGFLPTYARLVYYHALYDLALSFEGSALVGCSSFAARGAWTRGGRLLVGRNFDLEQDVFDHYKVVFLVEEEDRIPYLSVSWAGFTGVVTGMNAEGLFVAVNGARGGENRARGVPLPFVLREILQQARTVEEAEAVARRIPVMVPHLLLVAAGESLAVFERTPQRMVVRTEPDVLPLTNHYADPALAADPRNRAVIAATSTRERYARLRELLEAHRGRIDVAAAVEILRDRAAPGGQALAMGDRRAIDASIATHSVVADLTDRILWVAEAPHTAGRYVPFDLPALLGERAPRPVADIPAIDWRTAAR